MITFIRKTTVWDGKVVSVPELTKIRISSETPPKQGQFYDMNRQQRRNLIYAQPVQRLQMRIDALRKQMRKAGVTGNELLPIPKRHSRKILSGYMSALKQQFRDWLRINKEWLECANDTVEGW